MAKKRALSVATLKVQRGDVQIPTNNWHKWRDVFEHSNPRSNPLLRDPARFRGFVAEYSVARTIREGTIDKLREALRKDRGLDFLNDPSGMELDTAEAKLRRRFGTLNGERGIRSALSKIAAFLKPGTFVAFDKYALVGVRRLRRCTISQAKARGLTTNTSMTKPIGSYADYLEEMNKLLAGNVGDDIRKACKRNYPSHPFKDPDRFHRRVLDIYVSRIGSRKFK